ncbi:MAG TPA: hypothetical protein P5205_06430 [Candidatus Paceibacterota bacterium]|nr:hypothetical protein [Verrucomicrobiota bacterium]HSA09992.1 hypothetical protein [Candidatus Paceibacterota bacterium]
MPDPAPNAELLRSLGRLVRGLSALFWGLPISLIVCFHTAKAESLRSFGIAPPLVTTALLVFGLWQLGDFQRQERVWRTALDRAWLLSLVNFGLSPFLYWYNKVPANIFFLTMVLLMALSALAFLGSLNLVLRRLGAMLPDEALRLETRQFTTLNLNLLLATLLLAALYVGLGQIQPLPFWLVAVAATMERGSLWFLIPLVLLPLAMTMALLWKTKEVILDNVFSAKR